MMKAALIAILFQLHLTAAAQDENVVMPDKKGTWSYNFRNDGYEKEFKMTAAESTLFKQKLFSISETLHLTPVLAKPLGFDPNIYSRVFHPFNYAWHKQYFGIAGELNIEFCTWFKYQGKEVKQTIEPPACALMLNDTHSTVGPEYLSYRSDGYNEELNRTALALSDFFSKPRKVKDLAPGVTLYDNDIIIVANEIKPYWIPVSLKEYYGLTLRYYELLMLNDPGNKIVYDIFKKEQDALSEEQLKGPAYRNGDPNIMSEISQVPNELPIMKFNPDYFNRKLPRTDVQLITLTNKSLPFFGKEETDFTAKDMGLLRLYQFMHSVDANQLRSLLDIK